MKTSQQYAIQYQTSLNQGGCFLYNLIHKHDEFVDGDKLLLDTEPNSHDLVDNAGLVRRYEDNPLLNKNIELVVIPYVNKHFRERMIKGWNKLKGFDVKVATYEFNLQYRNINEYVFNTGYTKGNPYTQFSNAYPSIRLEFIDVGMILMYKELEYTKLCKALSIRELDTVVWKNYVNQYLVNALIVNAS